MTVERSINVHYPFPYTIDSWEESIILIESEATTTLQSSAANATSTSSSFSLMLLLQKHSYYAMSFHPWIYGQ